MFRPGIAHRDARVYGHTTTAMHDNEDTPRIKKARLFVVLVFENRQFCPKLCFLRAFTCFTHRVEPKLSSLFSKSTFCDPLVRAIYSSRDQSFFPGASFDFFTVLPLSEKKKKKTEGFPAIHQRFIRKWGMFFQ